MATGVLARGALISAIYKKSLRLTVGARALHPNGKLMNHLSSDISRVDYCAQWFHAVREFLFTKCSLAHKRRFGQRLYSSASRSVSAFGLLIE